MTSLHPALTAGLVSLECDDKHWSGATAALAETPHPGVPLTLAPTPAFTLDLAAMEHNIRSMHTWVARHGAELAPHGKTTMAPALWSWQLAEGATAITVANEFQLRVARRAGIGSVVVANEMISPAGLSWLAAELGEDFDVTCWVDSVDGVRAMQAALSEAEATRPLGVCVEIGAVGTRCGARTDADVDAIVDAVKRAPALELRGVSGFEGSIKTNAYENTVAEVRGFLARLADTFERIVPHVESPQPMVSAGGSMYFDLVLDALTPILSRTPAARLVLRSGAYLVHDDGLYRDGTPHVTRSGPSLLPAAHIWATVISTPEEGLALLDAGKRDVPYDLQLPEVQRAWRSGAEVPVDGAVITSLADQHAFVSSASLKVGDLVRLGISHPCTAFDKWRTALLVEGADVPVIRGAIRTYF